MKINKILTLTITILSLAILGSRLTHAQNTPPACAPLPSDTGSVISSITLDTTATYTIWSRLLASDATNNSYYLQIDNACAIKVGDSTIPANAWTWINYQDGNPNTITKVSLTAGDHVIKLIGAEPNVGVDRLLFLRDNSCVPSGVGDNCTILPTATMVPVTPTDTPPMAPTATTTPQPTLSAIPTAADMSTPTPTVIATPTPHVIELPTPTNTPTPTPSPTHIPTPTPTPDKKGPTISITSPSNGSTIPSDASVTITAHATDPSGMNRVEFYVDDSLICTDTSALYTCSFKTSAQKERTYTITAKAYDKYNNLGATTVKVLSL